MQVNSVGNRKSRRLVGALLRDSGGVRRAPIATARIPDPGASTKALAKLVENSLRALSRDKVDRDRLKAYRHALRKRGLGALVATVDVCLTADVCTVLVGLPVDERAAVINRYATVCAQRNIVADDACALMFRSVLAGLVASRLTAKCLAGKGSSMDLKNAERLAASSRLDAMQGIALAAASEHIDDPILAAHRVVETKPVEIEEPSEPLTDEELAEARAVLGDRFEVSK